MASGLDKNFLKLDGEALANFVKQLDKFDASAVNRDAMVNFVKSLKVEDGMPPMEMNELVPIVEECFREEYYSSSMERGVKEVLNKVASRLPMFVSRFDGGDIEMLLLDGAGFEKAFTEALKSVPRANSGYELEVSKDCLCKVIYSCTSSCFTRIKCSASGGRYDAEAGGDEPRR